MLEQFYASPFPILDLNEEYFLREQLLEDTEPFFEYYARPEVGRFILATPPNNLSEAESEIYYCRGLFRNKKGIYWTIARKSDNRMVGAVGFYMNNYHRRAEISYDLSPACWRKGIMHAAINRVTQFGFEKMGLNRIEAVTMPKNEASMALLKKCGYQHEGLLKNYKFFQGRSYDIEMFSRIPE